MTTESKETMADDDAAYKWCVHNPPMVDRASASIDLGRFRLLNHPAHVVIEEKLGEELARAARVVSGNSAHASSAIQKLLFTGLASAG